MSNPSDTKPRRSRLPLRRKQRADPAVDAMSDPRQREMRQAVALACEALQTQILWLSERKRHTAPRAEQFHLEFCKNLERKEAIQRQVNQIFDGFQDELQSTLDEVEGGAAFDPVERNAYQVEIGRCNNAMVTLEKNIVNLQFAIENSETWKLLQVGCQTARGFRMTLGGVDRVDEMVEFLRYEMDQINWAVEWTVVATHKLSYRRDPSWSGERIRPSTTSPPQKGEIVEGHELDGRNWILVTRNGYFLPICNKDGTVPFFHKLPNGNNNSRSDPYDPPAKRTASVMPPPPTDIVGQLCKAISIQIKIGKHCQSQARNLAKEASSTTDNEEEARFLTERSKLYKEAAENVHQILRMLETMAIGLESSVNNIETITALETGVWVLREARLEAESMRLDEPTEAKRMLMEKLQQGIPPLRDVIIKEEKYEEHVEEQIRRVKEIKGCNVEVMGMGMVATNREQLAHLYENEIDKVQNVKMTLETIIICLENIQYKVENGVKMAKPAEKAPSPQLSADAILQICENESILLGLLEGCAGFNRREEVRSCFDMLSSNESLLRRALEDSCKKQLNEAELRLIMANRDTWEFYIALFERLRSHIRAGEVVASGTIQTSAGIRNKIMKAIRTKGKKQRMKYVAGEICSLETTATLIETACHNAPIPGAGLVGSFLALLLKIKDQREQHMAVVRISYFAAFAELSYAGQGGLEGVLSRCARNILWACQKLKPADLDDGGDFPWWKRHCNHIVGCEVASQASEGGVEAAEQAVSCLMNPQPRTDLYELLFADEQKKTALSCSLPDALAAATLGVPVADIEGINVGAATAQHQSIAPTDEDSHKILGGKNPSVLPSGVPLSSNPPTLNSIKDTVSKVEFQELVEENKALLDQVRNGISKEEFQALQEQNQLLMAKVAQQQANIDQISRDLSKVSGKEKAEKEGGRQAHAFMDPSKELEHTKGVLQQHEDELTRLEYVQRVSNVKVSVVEERLDYMEHQLSLGATAASTHPSSRRKREPRRTTNV